MADNNENDKLFEALFPEDWYIKVTEAINFAIHKLHCPSEAAASLAKQIIDYNIEKRLDEAFKESAETLLPRNLNWSKISKDDAFRAFTALLETCEVFPRLKSYRVQIKFSKNNIVYNSFLIWKEVASEKFRNLRLRSIKTKTPGTFILEIKKLKQNM